MRILNGLFGITMVLFSIVGLGFAVEALVLVSFKYSGIVSKHSSEYYDSLKYII